MPPPIRPVFGDVAWGSLEDMPGYTRYSLPRDRRRVTHHSPSSPAQRRPPAENAFAGD